MSKSKRLMALMIAVNKRRKFTVRELAEEFGVSARTIMRDLKELDDLGLPLYAEYGPHGGYRVLNERLLPPIMFSEEEAVAMFFAYQSLQHYGSLPFDKEATAALGKFYYYLPDDTKQRIDTMKERVVFWTPKRPAPVPFLTMLLDAAVGQKPVTIIYDSREGANERGIQPIGVYSNNGFWYCPAYCFSREKFLLFRVDRVLEVKPTEEGHPQKDVGDFPITRWFESSAQEAYLSAAGRVPSLEFVVRLSPAGVRQFRWESWTDQRIMLENPDGGATIKQAVRHEDLDYFVRYFLGFGPEAVIIEPPEAVAQMERMLQEMCAAYQIGKAFPGK